MKKILSIGLLFTLMVFTCKAQQIYSKENLEKASLEDLNLYIEKAQKLKKTGKIITLVGSATALTGMVIIAGNSERTAYYGFYLLLAGAGVTVIGLPVLSTGSSRVKKINAIKNTAFDGIKMDLTPCSIYNYTTQNQQAGITLKISF